MNEPVAVDKMASLISVLEDARFLIQNQDQFASSAANGLVLLQENEQDALQHVPSFANPPSKIIPNHVDIYVISSEEDSEYCQLFGELVISHNQSLIIKKSFEETNLSARLSHLDNARLIIPLLSSSFVESTELVHELNIAWCRQRYASDICFLAIALDNLPYKPTYIHLFPCFFNCTDKQWKISSSKLKKSSSSYREDLVTSSKAPPQIISCLANAVELFLGWMIGKDCPCVGLYDKFTNCLHLTTCVQHFKDSVTNDEKNLNEKAIS